MKVMTNDTFGFRTAYLSVGAVFTLTLLLGLIILLKLY